MADGGVKENLSDAVTRAKRRVGVENPSAADDDGNVGTVRGALRAFGSGEIDQFLDALHPEVTWEAPGGNFPGDKALDGRDAVRDQYIADAKRTFATFGFQPEKFLDAGDENSVVVLGTFVGDGAEGVSVSEPAVQVWQFQGTTAEHIRIYADSAAFPEVVTEEREKEWEEEEKEKERKEKEEAEGGSDDDSEGKSEESSESKSDDDSESKSEDSSESKSEDSSESKSEDSSESKSEDSSDSDSEQSDSDSEKSESS